MCTCTVCLAHFWTQNEFLLFCCSSHFQLSKKSSLPALKVLYIGSLLDSFPYLTSLPLTPLTLSSSIHYHLPSSISSAFLFPFLLPVLSCKGNIASLQRLTHSRIHSLNRHCVFCFMFQVTSVSQSVSDCVGSFSSYHPRPYYYYYRHHRHHHRYSPYVVNFFCSSFTILSSYIQIFLFCFFSPSHSFSHLPLVFFLSIDHHFQPTYLFTFPS